MTLSGYLHTIHTPHFKHQLNILRQQHPHRTNSSSDQSKAATADANQANNAQKVPLFSKIFSQQQSTESAHEESALSSTKHHDDLNTTEKPLLNDNETVSSVDKFTYIFFILFWDFCFIESWKIR
jgi:hypothetical protein